MNQPNKSVVKILSSKYEHFEESDYETGVDMSHTHGDSQRFDVLINGVHCSLEFTAMSTSYSSHEEDVENGGYRSKLESDSDKDPDRFASCNFVCRDDDLDIDKVESPSFGMGGASLHDFAEVLYSEKPNQKFLTDTVPLEILETIAPAVIQKRINQSSDLSM